MYCLPWWTLLNPYLFPCLIDPLSRRCGILSLQHRPLITKHRLAGCTRPSPVHGLPVRMAPRPPATARRPPAPSSRNHSPAFPAPSSPPRISPLPPITLHATPWAMRSPTMATAHNQPKNTIHRLGIPTMPMLIHPVRIPIKAITSH